MSGYRFLIGAIAAGAIAWMIAIFPAARELSSQTEVIEPRHHQADVAPRPVFDPLIPNSESVLNDDKRFLDDLYARLRKSRGFDIGCVLHHMHLFGADEPLTSDGETRTTLLEYTLDGPAIKNATLATSLVRTRHGVSFPIVATGALSTNQKGSISHAGQAIAEFALLGVPLSEPIVLTDGTHACLFDLFNDLLANFNEDEPEIYWDAIAIFVYGPLVNDLRDKFGDPIDRGKIVQELLSREPLESSCAGTHGLIALAVALRCDDADPFLDRSARDKLEQYLKHTVTRLTEEQNSDGSWDMTWCEDDKRIERRWALGQEPDELDKLIATGHHIEWLTLLPADLQPKQRVMTRAGLWLSHFFRSHLNDPRLFDKHVCPITHGVRSLAILCGAGSSGARDDEE